MSADRTHTTRRVLATLVLAVSTGALIGNLVAGALLDLDDGWQTVLWFAGAGLGGALTWATSDDEMPSSLPTRTLAWAGLVLLVAISLVVLLGAPAGYYAAGGALLLGGAALLVLSRRP